MAKKATLTFIVEPIEAACAAGERQLLLLPERDGQPWVVAEFDGKEVFDEKSEAPIHRANAIVLPSFTELKIDDEC